MGLIFFLSSETATESSATSGSLIRAVVNFLFPDLSAKTLADIVSGMQFIVRKGAHFSLYAVLGILSFLTLITYEKIALFLRIALSILIGFGYAVSDEYHQTFIIGRSGELRDVLIDFSGVTLGVLFCLLIYLIRKHKKKGAGLKLKKKQYMELCETLQKRLNTTQHTINDLKEENAYLTRENADLVQELHNLRESVANMQSVNAATKEAAAEAPVFSTENEDFVVETIELSKKTQTVELLPEVQNSTFETPVELKQNSTSEITVELSENVLSGAEIIGKIVMCAAEYCNTLTAIGDNSSRELVNLILGRTEVAKSEILNIVTSDMDDNLKLQAMESELAEAEDYFKSVMAQK